jgi:hypothetical protein
VHDSLTQVVPDQCRQAPAPSHMPSWPQLDCVSCEHSLSGSVPATIGRQKPSPAEVFAFAQAEQAPAQADSQQTASTQKLLEQSPDAVQLAPSPFFPVQVLPVQKSPEMQSASD